MSLSDIRELNLKEVNIIAEAILDKREIQGNDMFASAYMNAILTSLAVWGSKEFPKQVPTFRVRPKTQEEIEKELLNQIMQVGMNLTLEAERPETDKDKVAYNKKKAKELYEKFVAKDIDAIDK